MQKQASPSSTHTKNVYSNNSRAHSPEPQKPPCPWQPGHKEPSQSHHLAFLSTKHRPFYPGLPAHPANGGPALLRAAWVLPLCCDNHTHTHILSLFLSLSPSPFPSLSSEPCLPPGPATMGSCQACLISQLYHNPAFFIHQ